METVDAALLSKLSGRQRDCIMRVKKGLTSKEIARELNISHRTVELHVAAAMEKLGVSNRYAAIALLHGEDVTGQEREPLMLQKTSDAESDYLMAGEPAPDAAASKTSTLGLPVFPPLGGKSNEADHEQRKTWMFRIALASIMLTCFVILSVLGVIELANAPVATS